MTQSIEQQLKQSTEPEKNRDDLLDTIIKYSRDPHAFIFDHCFTLDKNNNRWEKLPQKKYIEDIITAFYECPIGGEVFIIKSRQMLLSWISCAYCVWALHMHQNYEIIWTSINQEHSTAILNKRIKGICERLTVPVPTYEFTYDTLKIPALGNRLFTTPKGTKHLTGGVYDIAIFDEFCKVDNQEELLKESIPATMKGKRFFVTTPVAGTLGESMVHEE